jgi:hypothetical protein
MLPLMIRRTRGQDGGRGLARGQICGIGVAIFIISLAIGAAGMQLTQNPLPLIAAGLVGVFFLFAVRVAEQWQKAAVLRLGRYIGLRGPGVFFIIPVIDEISQYIDQRVRVTDVKAESALTRDTVPVNVDAIVFWLVWNAEKSILEVMDFDQAITLSAQTALRESIGRHDLSQMITEREMLGKELQRILDEKTNPWGNHGAVGGDSRRSHTAGTGRRHVAAGASGEGTSGSHHSGYRGN